MSEHAIALRRAWNGHLGETTARVDLPTIWEGAIPDHLSRRFNRPPIGPGESLVLRLQDVPGVIEAILNGTPLTSLGDDPTERTIEELRPSGNELVLRLDPIAIPPGASWGRIALVVISPER